MSSSLWTRSCGPREAPFSKALPGTDRTPTVLPAAAAVGILVETMYCVPSWVMGTSVTVEHAP